MGKILYRYSKLRDQGSGIVKHKYLICNFGVHNSFITRYWSGKPKYLSKMKSDLLTNGSV